MNKIDKLNWRIGALMCQVGTLKQRKALHLKPVMKRFFYLEKFFKEQQVKVKLNPADNEFYFTTWETMKEIIAIDWTDQHKYIKERFDCEDFAYAFKAHMSEIYHLNGIGVSHGHCYTLSGKWKYGHFWCAIPTIDNGQFNLHWLEVISDRWAVNKINKQIIIRQTEYRPLSIRF